MATITSASSGNLSNGGTWVGGVSLADGDTMVIAAGHEILMDEDMSAWTGLAGACTIAGHATTPGMLYWKDGTSGTLKLRTGATLLSTTGTLRGRVLANSDGVWGNTGALSFADKAVILLEGTAKITGSTTTYLDNQLYCTQPTIKRVRTYGTKFTVTGSASADTLTKVAHGLVNNTAVRIMVTGGDLQAPLEADFTYYVKNKTDDNFQLADTSGGPVIDLTTDGTGTIEVYTGHTNLSTGVMNVLDDVSADTGWTTDADHNRVVLVNIGPQTYDIQRTTITGITAGTITLAENVNSVQYPGAVVALSSRNVSIRTNTTGSAIENSSNGVYQCEIVNTAGTNTMFYGSGFYGYYLSNYLSNVFSGAVSGFNYGVNGTYGSTFSGDFFGCNCGVNSAYGSTISGDFFGCYYGALGVYGSTISGDFFGCNYGAWGVYGSTISGDFFGCNYGVNGAYGSTFSGDFFGCYYVCGVSVGYVDTQITGRLIGNTVLTGFGLYPGPTLKNAYTGTVTPTVWSRNINLRPGRVLCENLNRVLGLNKIIDAYGDVLQTACAGAGDAPTIDPNGGNGDVIEASNLQSNCSATCPLYLFKGTHKIWVTAQETTITYKIQSTMDISSGGLLLEASYIGTDGIRVTATSNTTAISTRSSTSDWSQTISITITPAEAGWVELSMALQAYEAGKEIYVWPVPTVTGMSGGSSHWVNGESSMLKGQADGMIMSRMRGGY